MNAAVIDRIRAYADDGMAPSRIATTLGLPEADVRRHLVGVMAPTNGVKSNVESPPMSPASVDEHRSDIGPETAREPDIKRTSEPAPKRKPTPPPPVPVRGDGRPTDKQRAIWALVVDGGLTRTEAAERLGILAPSVRNQLIAYMQHMDIEGPIPGRSERTGPKPRPTPDVAITSDSPTTDAPDRNTPQTVVISEPAAVGESRADHAETIPVAAPAPGILERIELELDALAREDARLVADRRRVQARIDRLRDAGEVVRELA